jgi:DNA invertase Pin-like site-specific DNA recombinase
MAQNQDRSSKEDAARPPVAAAIYARVSSAGQLQRDGDVDGYSIPAQIKACQVEAERRGITVAKAYVERAESARSDDRPVLQQMRKELAALGVSFLIVHKVDRLARNRLDDALLYHELKQAGITLVSATENIDETPAGRLMHGMLATFAEYYSNNLATEIKKGLNQKHQTGGTPFRAPIGYRPVRKLLEGREVRTIEIDPERGPLIQLAFTLYATGDWTLTKLTAHLRERGLIARPTPKQGGRPLSRATVHAVLKNPYYMGVVEYAGKRVVGRHDPLVDKQTFERVQMLLAAARCAGDRSHKHDHFLRGMLYCSECGGRLLFGRHRGRNGTSYDYFSCANRNARRRARSCSTGHYSVPEVEDAVESVYASMRVSESVAATIRHEVREELDERRQLIEREASRHVRRIKQIEANQAKLVQLYYKDLVSEDVLEQEQTRLREEKAAADRLLRVATLEAEEVEGALDEALRRVDKPGRAYRDGTPLERRVMNGSFFERIEVGPAPTITEVELTPITEALRAWEPSLGTTTKAAPSSDAQVRPSSSLVHLAKCLLPGGVAASALARRWGPIRASVITMHHHRQIPAGAGGGHRFRPRR